MRIGYYNIAFQEIPDEINLIIGVQGCDNNCEGCHSPELHDPKGGFSFPLKEFERILKHYNKQITCVVFFGGEDNPKFPDYVNLAKKYNLKVALYTGADCIPVQAYLYDLDYIKIGRYIQELGGLDSETTNQKLFNLKTNQIINMNRPK